MFRTKKKMEIAGGGRSAPRAAACLQRHRARLLVAALLLAVLAWVIGDQIVRPCTGCAALTNASSAERPCACLSLAFESLTEWIAAETLAGSIVCTLVLAGCAVVLIPASALTIGVGAAFARALGVGAGVAIGSVVVWVGLSIGAECAFLLARYLLRDAVERQLRKFRLTTAIDAALKSEGLKVMVLLRLSPIIPFNAFNYVIAATAVSLRHYTLALVAMIPATVGYVYIGATIAEAVSRSAAGEGASTAQTVQTVFLIVGAVAALVAVAAVAWVAKRRLRRMDADAAAGSGGAQLANNAAVTDKAWTHEHESDESA